MADTRSDELRKRLEKEPGSRLFAQLAEELRKEGELEEAISVAREGLAKHPAYHSARMTLARCLLETGELARSRTEFEAVLKSAPDNILASRLLGECLEGLGDLQAARARFKTTLALAPGDKQVQASLEGVEAKLAAPVAPKPAAPAEPVAAEAESEPAPIPLVAAEETFELEGAHEVSFRNEAPPAASAAPAAPTSAPPAPPPPAAPPALQAAAAANRFEPEPEPEFVDFEAEARTARTSPIEIVSRVPLVPEPAETIPRAAALVEAAPPPIPAAAPAEAPAAAELASPTLAELYWSQGHTSKAIEVYEELLGRDPANDRARARLIELKAAAAGPVVPAPPADPREARRTAIRKTISRLEGMLDAVKRG